MKDKIIELGYSSPEAEELLKVSNNIEKDYEKLLKQYPIQYLIGYVNFYGYKINVDENVLIPRYETEFLVEKTIKYSKELFNNKVDILDIGTGSGAIAIALNKELRSNVTACDISEEALKIAKNNAIENDSNIDFVKSDIYSNINGKFDVIISNPPYIGIDEEVMDSVKKYEPHIALYGEDNGLYFYKKILKNARNFLKDKYLIAFEIGYWQGNEIVNIAREYFNDAIIFVEKDLSGKDRYIFIKSE